MAFEERTVQMTCPACETNHAVRWARMPVREISTVKCIKCDTVMFHGNTVLDYHQVRLAA